MLDISIIKEDLEKIEELNNKEKRTRKDLNEGHRLFKVFSDFIDNNSRNFKKFKGDDKYMYEEINDWNERQSSIVSDIKRFGFKNVISGDETQTDWIIYEAWILGDLIKKYKK